MNNFTFNNPTKVLFGKNTIDKIGKEINRFEVKKVLLLYGKSSIFKNGVYDTTVASLKENNIEFVELGGVKPNPVLSKVNEAVELCKRENIDGILAVGGGSVIDSAKVIAAAVCFEGDIWDCFEGKAKATKSLPIFTILTLSATGSEMNSLAVITKEDEFKKWAFSAGVSSYPKVTIIDPSIQFTLPQNQIVNGTVDVLSHLFEQYFDKTESTDIQNEMIEGIIRTVMKHGEISVTEPENYESRAQLAWSATMAFNGIVSLGKSGGDWSSHKLEHSLSAYFDVAHGAGLAIIFPAWMKYVCRDNPSKFIRLAKNVFCITEGSEIEIAYKMIDELKKYFKKLGAPISLKEIGVEENDIEKLVENASILAPLGNYKKLEKDDIRSIYKLAL